MADTHAEVHDRDRDDGGPTPVPVTIAASVGTAPLPFLAVYTALFLLHGLVHPVHPPDITSSQHGEVVAGCVTGALFIVLFVAIVWFVGGRRRWPFAVLELAMVGTGVWFLADSTRGGPVVSVLLILAAAISLFFAFAPDAWRHVGRNAPPAWAAAYRAVGLGPRSLASP